MTSKPYSVTTDCRQDSVIPTLPRSTTGLIGEFMLGSTLFFPFRSVLSIFSWNINNQSTPEYGYAERIPSVGCGYMYGSPINTKDPCHLNICTRTFYRTLNAMHHSTPLCPCKLSSISTYERRMPSRTFYAQTRGIMPSYSLPSRRTRLGRSRWRGEPIVVSWWGISGQLDVIDLDLLLHTLRSILWNGTFLPRILPIGGDLPSSELIEMLV